MDKTKRALQNYVNSATDLAESVKQDIQHNDGIIDKETVLALNKFTIAANEIEHLTNTLKFEEDPSLN